MSEVNNYVFRLKLALYDLFKINEFLKFFNNFGTALIGLFLVISLFVLFVVITSDKRPSSAITAAVFGTAIGLWVLLFVSSTLRQIVVEDIRESIEKELFDRIDKIEKKSQVIEKKLDKILDIIYDNEKEDTDFSAPFPEKTLILDKLERI